MNGSTNGNFLAELNRLNAEHGINPSKATESAIEHAAQMAVDLLLTSNEGRQRFERGARGSAEVGKKVYRVDTWSGRGPRYGEWNMVDLLQKGNFILKAQNWLNSTYGPGFTIFNHKLTQENMYSLTVSWDAQSASGRHASPPWDAQTQSASGRRAPPPYPPPTPSSKFHIPLPRPTLPLPPPPPIIPITPSNAEESVPQSESVPVKLRLRPKLRNAGVPSYKD